MPKKSSIDTSIERIVNMEKEMRVSLPQLFSLLNNEADFVSLLVKMRDDGNCLAIAKAIGEDGTPMVCFGAGYGYILALFAIERTMAGNHWRQDKPWKPPGS